MKFPVVTLFALSFGSLVFASPAPTQELVKRDNPSFTTIIQDLLILESTVAADVANITALLAQDIPAIAAAFDAIVTDIENVIADLVQPIIDIGTDIVNDITKALTSLKNILTDVENIVSAIANSIISDAEAAIKGEVDAILALVSPFVTPIVDFAENVTSTLTDPATVAAINTLITDIEGLIGKL